MGGNDGPLAKVERRMLAAPGPTQSEKELLPKEFEMQARKEGRRQRG